METLSHEPQPTLSIVERQKSEAENFIKGEMEKLVESGKSKLEAAKIVFDTVKGQEYREEQALSKLLEYFNLRQELYQRAQEINREFPVLAAYSIELDNARNNPAANDDHFTGNLDDKFQL